MVRLRHNLLRSPLKSAVKSEIILWSVPRGSYCIIRSNGVRIVVKKKPTLQLLHEGIGCSGIDMIMLTRGEQGAELAMAVDDVGALENKPENPHALVIVRGYKPGYPGPIYGDVILIDDRDFGGPEGW